MNEDNVAEYIIGSDNCNSYVDLKIRSSDGGRIKEVRLARMFRPVLRIAEDLFENLIVLRNILGKIGPDHLPKLERVLDAISALQISRFDDHQVFLDKMVDPVTQKVSPRLIGLLGRSLVSSGLLGR